MEESQGAVSAVLEWSRDTGEGVSAVTKWSRDTGVCLQ